MTESGIERAADRAPASTEVAEAPRGAATVTLADRYEIDPSAPLPHFDSDAAKAYAVTDAEDPTRPLYALVCQTMLPPRIEAMEKMRGVGGTTLLRLDRYGVVDWPPLSRRSAALVLERPEGSPLVTSLRAKAPPYDETFIARRFLPDVLDGLRTLHQHGIAHRAIRPDAIFFRDADQSRVVLGECYSAPTGSAQPPVFETIPCGLSHPMGRGAGAESDDFYALGVTILHLLLGRSPADGRSDRDVIDAKLDTGSFAALVAGAELPSRVVELLRGLLVDDPGRRWGHDAIEQWMGGKHPPSPAPPVTRAARAAFSFRNREVFGARALAHAFACDWEAAAAVLKSGEPEAWLRRIAFEPNLSKDLGALVQKIRGESAAARSDDATVVTQACAILDPLAPLRYKDIAFLPDGIGTMLAHLATEKGNANLIVELTHRGAFGLWLKHQRLIKSTAAVEETVRFLRGHLQSTNRSSGVERCLYALNPALPCLSPLVAERYVTSLRHLLLALDTLGRRPPSGTQIIDRHIAAFVAVRDAGQSDSALALLDDRRPDRAALGTLITLARLQERLELPSLPGLTAWCASQLKPVVLSYASRRKRQRLENEIKAVSSKGWLPDLLRLVNDPAERRIDADGFASASRKFTQAGERMRRIDAALRQREVAAKHWGRAASVITAMIVAVATIVLTLRTNYL